jgi:type IV pilus assembly protein PilM
LLSLTVNYARQYSAWSTADVTDQAMKDAIQASKSLQQVVQTQDSTHSGYVTEFESFTSIGEHLQSNIDGRMLWLELLKAIDAALPKDERPADARKQTREDLALRPELHIRRMDLEPLGELSAWFSTVQNLYEKAEPNAPAAADANEAPAGGAEAATATEGDAGGAQAESPVEPAATGPTGPGFVIELAGYHFHNSLPDIGAAPIKASDGGEGREFVLNTFCRMLELGSVELPDGENGALVSVPISSLGISHPVIITQARVMERQYYSTPMESTDGGRGAPTYNRDQGGGATAEPEIWRIKRYDFVVQFCWKPTPRTMRKRNPAASGGAVAATASRPQ